VKNSFEKFPSRMLF